MNSKCFEYSFFIIDQETEKSLKQLSDFANPTPVRETIELLLTNLHAANYEDFCRSFTFKMEQYFTDSSQELQADPSNTPPTFEKSFFDLLFKDAIKKLQKISGRITENTLGKQDMEYLLYHLIQAGNPYKKRDYFMSPVFYYFWQFAELLAPYSRRIRVAIGEHDDAEKETLLLSLGTHSEFYKLRKEALLDLQNFCSRLDPLLRINYKPEYDFLADLIEKALTGQLIIIHKTLLPDL